MKPVVLSLDCTKLKAAIADIAVMQRWEVMRRSPEPLTTHGLAVACGVSDGIAQATLDLLVEAGLAVKLKANATRRAITYRVVSDRVIVEWDAESDAHLQLLLVHRQALRTSSRSLIDRNDTPDMRGLPGLPKFRGHQSFTLTRAEAESIRDALRSAWEFITRVENAARERAAAAASGDRRKDAHQGAGAEPSLEEPYHIALEFRPLKTADLPLADIGFWERKTLARELAYLSSAPMTVLTQREQEIANRLANGASRPEVAQALGVSVNTIASATKQIYAKLGVHNRAEFTARMKGS